MDWKKINKDIDKYLKRLFPINRSITGEGSRETLKILSEIVPIEISEYNSGTQVFDWEIPEEWNIQDAWIKNAEGEKIIDFKKSNIHVMSYSKPVKCRLPFNELKDHLHYIKELPDAIPYRTSYYQSNFGFCLSYNDYKKKFNENDSYEIMIDSSLKPGKLLIGEVLIKGRIEKEYLISTYFCHPSLANDNLSGLLLTAFLAAELKKKNLNFSYRIIFIPETIGAITYCSFKKEKIKKIDTGLVITTVGGPGSFGYKQSYQSDNYINSMVEDVFKENKKEFITYPFIIIGSDERQYSSQGFRINCVTITKDKYYEYPYYHTSLDNLDFVKPDYITDSLKLYLDLVNKMDKNIIYKNLYPDCEVMLSKHSLYPKTGGAITKGATISTLEIILWLIFYCDGSKSLYDISKILNVNYDLVYKEAKNLELKQIFSLIE